MPAVLRLIKELATFEKEPDAVVLTVDDLIKMVFQTRLLFIPLLQKKIRPSLVLLCITLGIQLGKVVHSI